ncbi:MAG: hypothetical protein J0I07_18350 [Myxococcales bacterium]|nr:hypothetical protein [Myxococcales bacterium]
MRTWARAVALTSWCAVVLPATSIAGCGSFDSGEVATPPDAGPGEDASAARPDADTSVDAATDAPCTPMTVTIEATADTSFASTCAGTVTNGGTDNMHVGLDNGAGVGLVRFDLGDDTAAKLQSRRIIGGRLRLHSNRNSQACGLGPDPQSGTMSVHPLRPDWDEGTSGGLAAGADRCRRAKGKGWGAADRAPSSDTKITGGGVDFDESSDSALVAADTDELTIQLRPEVISARGSIAAKQIAFVLRMVSGGRMIVATHEESAALAPRLEIDTCE